MLQGLCEAAVLRAMTDKNDPFKDLSFNGAPSEYRLFRRKIILHVASLEEKHVRLAGPKILTRLSGEAWRATEHLAVGELRQEDGWLKVLGALDEHYKFLPETELNECVDDFLFHLKKRSNEGPTAFISRFKTVLRRLETLVAADRANQLRRPRPPKTRPGRDQAYENGMPESESSFLDSETEADAAAAAAAQDETATGSKGPKDGGGEGPASSPKRKGPPSSVSQRSTGTHKGDEAAAQRKMLQSLERLEIGHLKLKPVLPAVVLGHLFMRKYGLNREQRAQVIRSTGGSSRFEDIEKVIRASDFEERHHEQGHRGSGRRDTVMVAEESSASEPELSSEEVQEAEIDSDDEELEEAYEVKQRAKHQAKKAFRNYKDSRRRVREIKKERQPYMPVVALNPDAAPPEAGNVKPTFRYDRKEGRRPGDKEQDRGRGDRRRKEEVSMVQAAAVTEFSYMAVVEVGQEPIAAALSTDDEYEILSSTVPAGMAVIDTGCTASVIGAMTAKRYTEFLRSRGLPEPEAIALPPVQLKGFNGVRSTAQTGLRWLVKIGCLWGHVTTYVVPGLAPFLLSRKVLQGMEATLNLADNTITSAKHGLTGVKLSQASNGHLLLPLVPDDEGGDTFEVCPEDPGGCALPQERDSIPKLCDPTNTGSPECSAAPAPIRAPLQPSMIDRKRHFQTVMKHTRYTQADVGTHKHSLRKVFLDDVEFALCAYRPRYERLPKQASTQPLYTCVAHLSPDGSLTVSPWTLRAPSARREPFDRKGACIFAFRSSRPVSTHVSAVQPAGADVSAPCLAEPAYTPNVTTSLPKHSFPIVENPEHPKAVCNSKYPKAECDFRSQVPATEGTFSKPPNLSCAATAGVPACDCCDVVAEAAPDVAESRVTAEEGMPQGQGLEAMYEDPSNMCLFLLEAVKEWLFKLKVSVRSLFNSPCQH